MQAVPPRNERGQAEQVSVAAGTPGAWWQAYCAAYIVCAPPVAPRSSNRFRAGIVGLGVALTKRSQPVGTPRVAQTVEPEDFIKCLKDLIRLDQDWIPEGLGYSMYMRPTMIATEPVLGVGKSNNAKLFVLLSPVGAYYSGGFKPVRLLADNKYVRAWPGGMGDTKSGGNYGPTIMPQKEAQGVCRRA